jgi:hypothetical protein
MSAASAVGMNPSEPGFSSKPYNADGGVVSWRAGGHLPFSKFVTTVDYGGIFKTGTCHRFDGGRKSTGISILRIHDPREPASRLRQNECLPGETLRVHGERISSARSRRRCSRGSRGCSMHWRKAEASRLSASARWPRAGGRFASGVPRAVRGTETSGNPSTLGAEIEGKFGGEMRNFG